MAAYHFYGIYPDAPSIIVPQTIYSAQGSFYEDQAIRFTKGGVPVLLEEARQSAHFGMDHGDMQPHMSTTAEKINLRIQWPGYDPWTKPVSVLEYDGPQGTRRISNAKLGHAIAKAVLEFYEAMSRYYSTADRPDWDLSNIPFHCLRLFQLNHVAAGSWQPVLSYCKDSGENTD
ncbi:hypothetical protein BDW22DRAFT_1362674 [Trametopsis cervina]|nr:hypothetical protein BDW22DRAFT_1362674 [Trametopsis cervina]